VSNRRRWSMVMDDTNIQACFAWIQSIQLHTHDQSILHVQPTFPLTFLLLSSTGVQTVHLSTRPSPLLRRRHVLCPLMSLLFKNPSVNFFHSPRNPMKIFPAHMLHALSATIFDQVRAQLTSLLQLFRRLRRRIPSSF
jgi:hypothetical protein